MLIKLKTENGSVFTKEYYSLKDLGNDCNKYNYKVIEIIVNSKDNEINL